MHTRPSLLALSFSALAVFLPGQTAAPVAPAAATTVAPPHILLETVGPDGWRVRLGPTNLGSLLESEKGRALWQPGVLPLLGMWQQLVGEEKAFAASRDRLLGYSGRIRVGIWFDPENAFTSVPFQAAMVLLGDGRTDLTALAKDLHVLLAQVPGEWTDIDVAGAKLSLRSDGSSAVSTPLVEGNSIVIASSTAERMATTLRLARGLAATAGDKPPAPTTPALRIDVDLAAIIGMRLGREGRDESLLMKALGLDSLGTLQFTVDTAGPQVRLELAQQFRSKDRGVFAALLPAATSVSSLRHAVPAGPGSWKVGHFDFAALYSAIEAAVVASERSTAEEFRAEAKKEMGVDVRDDLLAHMTDEVLLLTSPLAGLDSPDQVTWTFAVRLRDEAKFKKGLFEALPNAKPFLQREATEKVLDIEVHRYGGMAGYDIYIAVGNGVFVLAGGRDAEAQVAALLKVAKTLPADATMPEGTPDGFANLKRYLPPGTNGLAVGDIDAIAAMPTEWWLTGLEGLLPFPLDEGAVDPEQRDAVRTLLKQHNLNLLRTATGFADTTWRWRLFW
ncbi:MAG: hypothetical protein ABIP94_07345 [Planctomycetota bacterium]